MTKTIMKKMKLLASSRKALAVCLILWLLLGAKHWQQGGGDSVFVVQSFSIDVVVVVAPVQKARTWRTTVLAASSDWSITDDWNARSYQENRPLEGKDVFHQDLVERAAYYMQRKQHAVIDNNNNNTTTMDHDEAWMDQVVQDIYSFDETFSRDEEVVDLSKHDDDDDDDDDENYQLQLVDTKMTKAANGGSSSLSSSFMSNEHEYDEHVMSQEIAQLIRCNQEPTHFLIQKGRAMPALTEHQLHDVRQLVELIDVVDMDLSNPKPTPFFIQAIRSVFELHAQQKNSKSCFVSSSTVTSTTSTCTSITSRSAQDHNDDGSHLVLVLDRSGVATWLQRCLNIPSSRCGPHDSKVTKIVSQFGKYGQGYLELDDFERLYLQAILGGDAGGKTNSRTQISALLQQAGASSSDAFYKMLRQQRSYEIAQVWKDLEIHGIEPPALVEWRAKAQVLQEENGYLSSFVADPSVLFHDECEILDSDDAALDSWTRDDTTGAWKRTGGKSSYERIELCADGKTPLRFKDGDFVYIDEESCIGCTQCVVTAPGSFFMLENSGRARTFVQEVSPAVAAAVATCPVNCMHHVGYERLVELEQARDSGKLPKKADQDHHRHFGTKQATHHQLGGNTLLNQQQQQRQQSEINDQASVTVASQWIAHTPLYVSRMQSSDANHKDSIFHFLRNQCYKSKACPQKGCFDCPMYASNPTSNPHWQAKVQADYKIRAQTFVDMGIANQYRKTADL